MRIDQAGEPAVPRFDRHFFDGRERFTSIGAGSYGGKANGLLKMREILAGRFEPGRFPTIEVEIPTLTVVTTELFDRFVGQNHLQDVVLSGLSDERIALAFQQAELPAVLLGDLRALIEKVHTPLAVRSSSLLEDTLRRPFAGVYATKMLPNNQPDLDSRFRRLVEAIKFVWASTFFREARQYAAAADRSIDEEKMAVIIQEVVGLRRRDRFYPDLSGVARSYSHYRFGPSRPEEGVACLALGLGRTIVDEGVSWSYCPAHPRVPPPYGSLDELLDHAQTSFWAVNMGKPPAYDPIAETEYLVRGGLADAEEDGALRHLASTYDAASDRLSIGTGAPGARVLNFAPLLVLEEWPLNEAVRELLRVCEEAMEGMVEIEFAATLAGSPSGPARLGFLQVRPMAVSSEIVDIPDEEFSSDRAIVASDSVLGGGVIDTIRDIVYARPGVFEARHTRRIADDLAGLNGRLAPEGRPYLLIGFGRWGTRDPWLGIPVTWAQIAGARTIVEATFPSMNVDLSQGSHFFHNISSFQVPYFSVRHDLDRPVRWEWLEARPAAADTGLVRHVRLEKPIQVKVDGRTGRGVILAPAG